MIPRVKPEGMLFHHVRVRLFRIMLAPEVARIDLGEAKDHLLR